MKTNIFVLMSVFFVVVSAQKKRSDIEMMLMVLNNGNSRAIVRDGTFFFYKPVGRIDTVSLRDCASIAGSTRMVIYSERGIFEEKIAPKALTAKK